MAEYFEGIEGLLGGVHNTDSPEQRTWDDIVADQIYKLSTRYGIDNDSSIKTILSKWHSDVTLGYKHDANFAPHINGFYMIFMVHGPWYESYKSYVQGTNFGNQNGGVFSSTNEIGISELPDGKKFREDMGELTLENPNSYLNMLATDIDIPDITEEYTAVSSRLRNSFVPAREYFVSDFSISYIENINLDVMRYHEAWHKYMNLIRRGEVQVYNSNDNECERRSNGYFLDMPFSNAVWVAVFRPFTTEIQLIVKLIGVMPVTMPLKQVIGNRSASKMTVLNLSYKAADIFYKFYNSTSEFIADEGLLAKSFRTEVMHISGVDTSTN